MFMISSSWTAFQLLRWMWIEAPHQKAEVTSFKGEELTDSLLTGGSRWPCVTRLSVDPTAAVWLPPILEEGGCHAGRRLKSLGEKPHKEEMRLPANAGKAPCQNPHDGTLRPSATPQPAMACSYLTATSAQSQPLSLSAPRVPDLQKVWIYWCLWLCDMCQ